MCPRDPTVALSGMTTPAPLLYVALDSWFSSARLPKYLSQTGFRLIGICAPASPLMQVRHFEHRIVIAAEDLRTALESATKRFQPALIISADEAAIQRIQALGRQARDFPATISADLSQLLMRSLSKPAQLDNLMSKRRINEIAGALGIPVPRQAAITSAAEAEAFASIVGYPIVLKKEKTHGGMGVLLCRNAAEVVTNVFRLRASGQVRRGIAKLGIGTAAQVAPLRSALAAWPGSLLIAQEYIWGCLAFRTIVANDGRELAGFANVAERVSPPPFGSSSVVRSVDSPNMARATAMLTEELGLSGFAGIDFILERGSGRAVLLELNPRVTPTSHLGPRFGADLCAALRAELAGGRVGENQSSLSATVEGLVALFPAELMRDVSSAYLSSAYHDTPGDEPELIAAWRGGLSKRANRLRRLPIQVTESPQLCPLTGAYLQVRPTH